jgi:hypothetical protein
MTPGANTTSEHSSTRARSFWKIDDYNGNEGYDLVLTVMLASEY